MKKFILTSVACLQIVVLKAQVPATVKALNLIPGSQQASEANEAKNKKGKGWVLVVTDNENYPSPFILPMPKNKYIAVPFSAPER
jgi:hypothetical protein